MSERADFPITKGGNAKRLSRLRFVVWILLTICRPRNLEGGLLPDLLLKGLDLGFAAGWSYFVQCPFRDPGSRFRGRPGAFPVSEDRLGIVDLVAVLVLGLRAVVPHCLGRRVSIVPDVVEFVVGLVMVVVARERHLGLVDAPFRQFPEGLRDLLVPLGREVGMEIGHAFPAREVLVTRLVVVVSDFLGRLPDVGSEGPLREFVDVVFAKDLDVPAARRTRQSVLRRAVSIIQIVGMIVSRFVMLALVVELHDVFIARVSPVDLGFVFAALVVPDEPVGFGQVLRIVFFESTDSLTGLPVWGLYFEPLCGSP